jgi:hypothetical protein
MGQLSNISLFPKTHTRLYFELLINVSLMELLPKDFTQYLIRLLWILSLENMQTDMADMTKCVLEILVLSPGEMSGFVY